MSKKTAFLIFLFGTLSSAILFAILTIDTHRQVKQLTHADNLSEDVVKGKKVWEKYNCNDCHTILGFGGYYAPDMTKAYRRIGAEGITMVLKNPAKVFETSSRKMPNQNLSEKEIENLVQFLKWISEIDNNEWPPQDRKKKISSGALRLAGTGMNIGMALFKEKGCISCHSINNVGGNIGPKLENVGKNYSVEQIIQLIKEPQSIKPDSEMPPQNSLSDTEAKKIADYLKSLSIKK